MQTATLMDLLAKIHFASYKWIMILPCAMMAIDIVTGFLAAWFVQKNFESAKMRAGLVKKVGEILIILMGIMFTTGMQLPPYILKAISLYILLMECLSIIENLNKMGVPLPKFLKNFVNNVHNSIQNDSYDELKAKYLIVQAELQKYQLAGIIPAANMEDDGK